MVHAIWMTFAAWPPDVRKAQGLPETPFDARAAPWFGESQKRGAAPEWQEKALAEKSETLRTSGGIAVCEQSV
jgi:hypothetical protein